MHFFHFFNLKFLYMKRNLLFIFSFLSLNGLFAEANYVYHEATTNSVGCGSINYRSVAAPFPNQAMTIGFKVEFQFYTNQVWLYYTTDGTTPSGSNGAGSGTTFAVAGTYACSFNSGGVVDVAQATIPALPGGTQVKYIVSGRNTGDNTEIFGNGPGNPCGCGTPTNNSTLATVFSFTVLPVELTHFDAKTTENQVKLTWETATETNNKSFQIERSLEAENWFLIAEMAGAGNSRDVLQYQFTDFAPLAGKSFYRLRQIDFDGFSSLSPVRQIERKASEIVTIYPNPVQNGRFVVSTTTENEADLRVDLLDLMGRVVRVMDFTAQKGENYLEFLTNDLPEGMYSVRLFNGTSEVTSQKISIKNR
jgi:Secretion system C-terminal sorting domain